MAKLELSLKAAEAVRKLPRDSVLLRQLWRRLEIIAADPALETEPAPFPHPPDRLLAAFSIEDGRKQTWGFSVTLRVSDDSMIVNVLTILGAPAPYLDEYGDPDV